MHRIRCAMVVVFLMPAPHLLAANCSMSGYQFMFGQDTETHLTVKAGSTCGSTFGPVTPRPALAQVGGPSETTISQAATNGTASVQGQHHWEYRPRPGFIGKDQFVVAITGEIMARFVRRGTTHVTVNVDVVP